MTTMILKYSIGVKVPAGWRQVSVIADATQVSPGMAQVTSVREIDGEAPNRNQSRTGAHRQEFDGTFWAGLEVGKKKRLSACRILTEAEA